MRFTISAYGVSTKIIQVLKFDTERAGFTIQALQANTGKIYLSKEPTATVENSFCEILPADFIAGHYVGALYVYGDTVGDKILVESFSKNVQDSGLPFYQ